MGLEGGLFSAVCITSCVICAVMMGSVVWCLKKQRKNRLFIAGTQIERAGEALKDAGRVLLICKEDEDKRTLDLEAAPGATAEDNAAWKKASEKLKTDGETLEHVGRMLQSGKEDIEPPHVHFSNEIKEVPRVLTSYTAVIELLKISSKSLKSACAELQKIPDFDSNENVQHVLNQEMKGLDNIVKDRDKNESCCKKCQKKCMHTCCDVKRLCIDACCSSVDVICKGTCCTRVKGVCETACSTKLCNKLAEESPSFLLSLYRIVFHYSVEEIHLSEQGLEATTRREYLFSGYRIPRQPWMLHIYYLAMLLVVFNWFVIMLIDTAFYRKTTTCNDLNVRRNAYLCFDVSKPTSAGPIDCTKQEIKDDLDIHVLCYLENFNFPTAISLAFSFAQLIIVSIHISFTFTLWCVRKFSPSAAISVNVLVVAIYTVIVIICAIIADSDKHDEGSNFFYGDRMMRIFMVIWGFVTVILLTLFSPYNWLIDKHYRQYLSSYTYKLKKSI